MIKVIFGLFVGIFVLGLVARIVWWRTKKCLLGDRVCAGVQKRLPGWWEETKELLSYKPQGVTAVGFVSTLLWPFPLALNVLLVAYALEPFFPGGSRIVLLWVGTYSVFPLMMGLLYAIAQTGLVILHGYIESKWEKIVLMIIVALTFLVESGLVPYRAYLLPIDEEIVSPTIWDVVMLRGGVVIGGFLGLMVPIGTVLVGVFSFLQFVEPMIKASLHWFCGLVFLIGYGIIWWICGFNQKWSEEPTIKKVED